jgi:hypothetical protein
LGGWGRRRGGVDDQHPSMIYYTRIFFRERGLFAKRKKYVYFAKIRFAKG